MRLSNVFLLSVAALCSASPSVRVGLRTSWPRVPLILEAIESIALEEPDSFFPLVDALSGSENVPLENLTPEAIHQLVVKTAVSLGYLQEPGALASVELQLSLHVSSPKVQAFFQFYQDQQFGPETSDCESWVDWYGEKICDVESLSHIAGHEMIDEAARNGSLPSLARPKHLAFDHIIPAPSTVLELPPRTAIFYANPNSANFREIHSYLYKLSTSNPPRLEYIYRHIPPAGQDSSAPKTYLSGYGVALDLKKTDYLAVDDRRSSGQESSNGDSDNTKKLSQEDIILSLMESYPENTTVEKGSPLTEAEILGIGYQATQLIIDSSNPLLALTQVSQNFPKYSTSIGRRIGLNDSLLDEIQRNNAKAQAGVNMIWLNGLALQESDINPYALLRLLRKERSTVLSLTSLGLSSSQAIELLTHKSIGISQSDTGALDGLCDASDRPEGGSVIVWWNDITKDSRYARWNPSLSGLLRPVYPGQFHNVKQNLFNVVIAVDLSQSTALHFITNAINNIIQRGFPFRFGVVPLVETEDGRRMARLFYHSIEVYGRARTMGLFSRISQLIMPSEVFVDVSVVRTEFITLQQRNPLDDDRSGLPIESILNLGEFVDVDTQVEKARRYALRVDASLSSSLTGHAFINGKHCDLDDDFLRYMQTEVSYQLQHLQEKVFAHELTDEMLEDVSNYFYDLPETESRRSQYVYPKPGAGGLRIFNVPEILSNAGFILPSSGYLYPESSSIPLSTFVIADLDSMEGIELIQEATLSLTKQDSLSRLTFIHNPSRKPEKARAGPKVSSIVACLIANGFMDKVSPEDFAKSLIPMSDPDLMGDATQTVLEEESPIYQLLQNANINIDSLLDSPTHEKFRTSGALIARALGVLAGERTVIVNGRMVGPIIGNTFVADDFKALQNFEMRKRVQPVLEALTNLTITPEALDRVTYGNLVSTASSIISSVRLPDPSEQGLFNTAQRPRQRNYRLLERNHTYFELGTSDTAVFNFGVLLDPLSEVSPKWSVILKWLATLPFVYVEVSLNPALRNEMPLKRFYQYNLSPRLSFDDDGSEIEARTVFDGLPLEPIYTMAMDVHPSWLARPREALYDLDNIQLSILAPEDRERGLEAIYELDHIVMEGHARESLTISPPRGLQLQLSTIDNIEVDDTQVVANLGYFQFKAKPGVFRMDIREGRGRDVFGIESVGNEGWNSPDVDEAGNEITLTSFEGLTLYPRFQRRPGMERADVLDDFVLGESQKGFLSDLTSRVSSFFKPKAVKETEVTSRQADINIFTVASGLLYERFASIMILSVLRNTKSSVKFWFIENFLSPSFLEFLPHFAEAYGFEYELVTYKWPSWLRAQTEKQRIIWAYKILFLDVLFPMDLKKVIFVDADQIVRADLKELVDLDLHGAPYGYTPMGDDNVEMEGFRFWKTGYWKDFLQDRPYHISALYVVDLVRFRQLAAGDMLRGQYQSLSQDPNSLANLDQDLPNNLQREVPIFSLHEDWLWCETWCSKDRLHRAKTIDLCQNPLTKEPKLARARQIPEWESYDAEIARFARRLADEGKMKSHVAAADSNVLASANANAGAQDNNEQDDDEIPASETADHSAAVEESAPEQEHTKDEL